MLTSAYLLLFVLVVFLGLPFALRRRQSFKFNFPNLWTWRGRVGRGTYVTVGVIGFAIKHNIDRAVASLVFDRPFDLFNYWIPPVDAIRISMLSREDASFLFTMVAVSLPFVWIGLGLTLRRLRCAGLPLWLGVLFFVPMINLVFFLALSLIPETTQQKPPAIGGRASGWIPDSMAGSAAIAVIVTGAIGAALIYLGGQSLGTYGWGVFVALPFCMGLGSVMIYAYPRHRSLGTCLLVSLVSVGFVALALFALAVEGLICIVMAIPIALPLALFGGAMGFLIQRWRSPVLEAPSITLLAVAFPLVLMGMEVSRPSEASLNQVVTTIRITAPAETVWRHLIAFPDLPEAKEWLFRFGVSHPVRATIHDEGVGAIRECLFSTGTFVERIDVWEPGRRMAFSVVSGADALRELSPYEIHPRHLDGYFAPEKAEFILTPNADGSTTLEGRSWYRISMWPGAYWRLWSDQILHDVHWSVFEHIKALSET